MTAKPLPRPRQVSFSGWSIIVGSVLTILFAFQRVSDLGSLEAQQAAADFISNPPGDGLGLTVDDVQTAIRVMCFIAAGTAAATAILGWQALQRSRSARVVLSFLAPVLFVAGLTSGGLFSALVAAGVVMLWAQPARDWFNGKEQAPQAPFEPLFRRRSKSKADPDSQPPAPAPQVGSQVESQAAYNPYGVPPAVGAHKAAGPTGRPPRVTAAVVITIVASTITLAGLLLSLAFLVGSRETFLVEIEAQMAGNSTYDDIAADAVATVALVFLVLLAIWCVAAIGLAIATLRGSNGARITLVVSAALSALVSLLGIVVIVPLLLTAASITTVVLLLGNDAAEWCARRGR